MKKYQRARKACLLLEQYLKGVINLDENKILYYASEIHRASHASFFFSLSMF